MKLQAILNCVFGKFHAKPSTVHRLRQRSAVRSNRAEPLEARTLLTLTFQFNAEAGTSREVISGFQEAGKLWESLFDDDVKVVVDIAEQNLGATVLGSTRSDKSSFPYTTVRNALNSDATTVDDVLAASNLTTNPALSVFINHTSDNPAGAGSATPYVDADGARTILRYGSCEQMLVLWG